MHFRLLRHIIILAAAIVSVSAHAQSNDSIAVPASSSRLNTISTPVDIDREKPQTPELHYYDKHGNPLNTPVRFLSELDTVVNIKSGPVYPVYNGITLGVNFFDGLMSIFGQKRGSFDVWGACSIHNWLFPVVEAGIGYSNAWPNDGRCNFKVNPSFYGKIGINYNFLYKSNPDYQVYVGLRAGMSSFNYDIYAITAGSDYYTEDGPTEKRGLHSTYWYGQALAGLQVKLWRGIAMGWSIRYAFNISRRFSDPDYEPWFVPGRGTGPLSATFSLIYQFGQKEKRPDIEVKP